MEEIAYITAPREGVNDDYVRVVEWQVREGDRVTRDQIVGLIETTKATIDITAPCDGYVFHLAPPGGEVLIGAPLAIITSSPVCPLPKAAEPSQTPAAEGTGPLITAKARPLMERYGFSAADFANLEVV